MSGKMKIFEVECPICLIKISAPGKALLFSDAKAKGWATEPGQGIVDCPNECARKTREDVEEKVSHIALFWKRMFKTAIPAWQKETGKAGVHPDLGDLIDWLIKKGEAIA